MCVVSGVSKLVRRKLGGRASKKDLSAEERAKLDAVKEGDGTMLDNTLIVFMSDSGDGHHPQLYNWPMVLIGNLGGRLKTDGRYLEFPGYGKTNHSTIASLGSTPASAKAHCAISARMTCSLRRSCALSPSSDATSSASSISRERGDGSFVGWRDEE